MSCRLFIVEVNADILDSAIVRVDDVLPFFERIYVYAFFLLLSLLLLLFTTLIFLLGRELRLSEVASNGAAFRGVCIAHRKKSVKTRCTEHA